MTYPNLPEDIILIILTFLQVKHLIRFTCVSRRFRSIILSDPKFAASQFQAARDRRTLTRRLVYSSKGHGLGSLDLETPWPSRGYHSSVRMVKYPFQPPAHEVKLLGSSNGIMFLVFDESIYYMWNPTTQFFKKLPELDFYLNKRTIIDDISCYGVGYLPATDDYKVFVAFQLKEYDDDEYDEEDCAVAIFSSRANAWRTLEYIVYLKIHDEGTLLKETLHWLEHRQNRIVAYDLAEKEGQHKCREMLLPYAWDLDYDWGINYNFSHVGVSAGGCLSLARYSMDCNIDVWIMREYDVRDS